MEDSTEPGQEKAQNNVQQHLAGVAGLEPHRHRGQQNAENEQQGVVIGIQGNYGGRELDAAAQADVLNLRCPGPAVLAVVSGFQGTDAAIQAVFRLFVNFLSTVSAIHGYPLLVMVSRHNQYTGNQGKMQEENCLSFRLPVAVPAVPRQGLPAE